MGRWANENAYDALVGAAIDSIANVDGPWPLARDEAVALVKGVIASESFPAFDPRSVRGEPHLADVSHGLMQLLYSTAQALGYPGPRPTATDRRDLKGLYDPGTNIYLGARLVRRLLVKYGGDRERMASAYNGGDRPSLALGTRATKAGRICLLWKPGTPTDPRQRKIDLYCARIHSYKVGEFGNQPYVTKVMANTAYFFASAAGSPPPPSAPTPPAT